MNMTNDELRQLLADLFKEKWLTEGEEKYSEWEEKFVFHIMDSLPDVIAFVDVLSTPQRIEDKPVSHIIHQFFLHAVPHLVSAGQIYDYIPEIFPEQRGVH